MNVGKVFDTLCHNKLIEHLNKIGVQDKALTYYVRQNS